MKTFDYKIIDNDNISIYLNGINYAGRINHISNFVFINRKPLSFLFDELGIINPADYYESVLGYFINRYCISPMCRSREDLLKVLDQMKKDFPVEDNLIGKKVRLNQEFHIDEYYDGLRMHDIMYEFLMSNPYYTINKIDARYYAFKDDSRKLWYPACLFSFIETNINNQNSNNNEIKFQNPKASFTRGSVPTGRSIRCRTNKITITSRCLGYSEISFGG